MGIFLQDIRHAVRQLARTRAATAIIVLTLALGIGANSSVFTMLNATLFKPLDVPESNRLVWVAERTVRGGRYRNLSYPNFRQYRAASALFDGVTAFTNTSVALGGEHPERVDGLIVSGNFFEVLRIQPALGRGFRPEEDGIAGAYPVVVLGDALWRGRFGASRGVIDSVITLNGQSFTVVGVAPAGFHGVNIGEPVQLFVPIAMRNVLMPGTGNLLEDPRAVWLRSLARLKPGVAMTEASAALALVRAKFRPGMDDPENAITAMALPVEGGLDPSSRSEVLPVFSLLMVVPFLVLLVACANVASLLLARGASRRKELSVRRAIGATRGRLIRQLLTESLVLALVAGAGGGMLSVWITALIVRVGHISSELSSVIVPDVRVLLFTVALALVTVLFFGLLPALSATSTEMTPALKGEGVALSIGRSRHRLRDAFVIGQVAVSLLLLITAGLFLRSLNKAVRVDPGFDPTNLGTVTFDLGLLGYGPERIQGFNQRLRAEVAALPGVESASLTSVLPLSGRLYGADAIPEGAGEHGLRDQVSFAATVPGYFHTMGIPLVAGRDIAEDDGAGAPAVVVINQSLAKRFWPGEDPIGKRLRFAGEKDEPLRTVIGVARDGKYADLTEDSRSFVYLPAAQAQKFGTEMALVMRASVPVETVLPAVVKLFGRLDRDLPLARVSPYAALLRERVDKQEAASAALGVFGALALLLAALGLYGVTAHGVAARTREIGIRMSLGAPRANVLALFVREGVALSLVGVAIGLVLSAAISKLLAGFLFGLTATDGLTFASGAVMLCAVAALASYLPARRAARVDPMIALRSE